ncbi:MAG: hypothetical protein KA791_13675 [Flavobacteriales bacterium]|nr:hypothetical protein [Flavobacteriales bacterium]MBP7515598.1 hypothetical protein [Flavobacteriales bacterium]
MDLKTLKLELLERIALIDNEERLLAVKRLLDAPRGYGIPNEMLSVVKDPSGMERTYTSEEVKRILEEDRAHQEALRHEPGDLELSEEELAVLDERRERHLKGESRSYTWDQVEEILKNDLKR